MSYSDLKVLLKIRRVRKMSGSERAATVQMALLIPIVSSSLAILGFRSTAAWIRRMAARSGPAIADDTTAISAGVAALRRATLYAPWTGRCLARALSLWLMLRRRGVNAELHLGVRRKGGALDAHAWLVHEGRVVADDDSVWTEYPGRFASTVDLDFRRDR